MGRTFSALFVVLAIAPSIARPQKGQSQSERIASPNKATIMSLLQQTHETSLALPLHLRLALLLRQAQIAADVHDDLGRQWADELFNLSFQAKVDERSRMQNSAVDILVRMDPNRALELLRSMDMEEPDVYSATPPKLHLASLAFAAVIERDGIAALPRLRQEAERLGLEGHYPYAALEGAAMDSISQDWGKDSQHAVQVLESVFEPMFAIYSQGAHGYFDDCEFGTMLQNIAGGLPFDSIRPPLHVLVKNLLATDTRKYHFQAAVYTNDGQKAKVDNAIDAALVRFGSLINRDPELARQLESARPELQTALEYAKDGRAGSTMFGNLDPVRTFLPPDPSAGSNEEIRSDAMMLSHVSADAAVAKAEQLPNDDERASAKLDIARSVAGAHPDQAAELIAETGHGDRAMDEQEQMNLVSAQVSVAAAQGKNDELRKLLQRGFELGGNLIAELQNPRMQFVPGLAPLVQIGIQNDPDLTIAFLQSLPATYEKAQLLLGAADALRMPPLPFGSRR